MEDYKTYSLNKLKDWVHDVMNSGDASPQEIYDAIKEVVTKEMVFYEKKVVLAKDLNNLLSGGSIFNFNNNMCSSGDTSPYCTNSWNDFWFNNIDESDIIRFQIDPAGNEVQTSWTVPIEEKNDDLVITFPDDLIKKVGWKENDSLTWTDNGDGTFSLKRTEIRTGID